MTHEGFQALVVEAEAVDDGLGLGKAEQARFGIAGLGQRGDGAQFEKTEAQCGQCVDVAGVLVHAGRDADAVGKGQAQQLDGVVDARWAQTGRDGGQQVHQSQAGVVGAFGILQEQQGAQGPVAQGVQSFRGIHCPSIRCSSGRKLLL